MCMALKLQEWKDGVTCNHTRAIVKWGSFPTAILMNDDMNVLGFADLIRSLLENSEC